jgi:hypothetical protein
MDSNNFDAFDISSPDVQHGVLVVIATMGYVPLLCSLLHQIIKKWKREHIHNVHVKMRILSVIMIVFRYAYAVDPMNRLDVVSNCSRSIVRSIAWNIGLVLIGMYVHLLLVSIYKSFQAQLSPVTSHFLLGGITLVCIGHDVCTIAFCMNPIHLYMGIRSIIDSVGGFTISIIVFYSLFRIRTILLCVIRTGQGTAKYKVALKRVYTFLTWEPIHSITALVILIWTGLRHCQFYQQRVTPHLNSFLYEISTLILSLWGTSVIYSYLFYAERPKTHTRNRTLDLSSGGHARNTSNSIKNKSILQSPTPSKLKFASIPSVVLPVIR